MVVRETMETCCKVFIVSTDGTADGLNQINSDYALISNFSYDDFKSSLFYKSLRKSHILVVARETMVESSKVFLLMILL